jgi:hypothetical protein
MDRAAEANRLARTHVWWQDPDVTLAEPRRLRCQILKLGRPEDDVVAESLWGREALRRALLEAGPGEIDAKSDRPPSPRASICSGPRRRRSRSASRPATTSTSRRLD